MQLRQRYIAGAIIAAVVGAVYWRCVRYPFIYDDWIFLHSILFQGPVSFLQHQLLPFGRIIYRPIGALYFVLMYYVSGVNPIGNHVVALLLHTCSAFLVLMIVFELTRNSFMSAVVSVLYAAAAAVHVEPLLWLSGFYDIGGAFFFLLSIYSFLLNKRTLSVVAFALAALTKEGTIVLPLILACYLVLFERHHMPARLMAKRILPHFVVLALYVILKMMGMSPLSSPAENPFSIRLFGPHVLSNLFDYVRWADETILPFNAIAPGTSWVTFQVAAAALILIALIVGSRMDQREESSRKLNLILFFGSWFLAGLLPVLFLPHHIARYFATYSLVPFLALAWYTADLILHTFHFNDSIVRVAIVLMTASEVIFSTNYIHHKETEDIDGPATEGSLNLIHKGKQVEIVKGFITRTLSPLAPHSVLIGDCLPMKAIGYGYGPQVWFHDTTLRLVGVEDIHSDSTRLYMLRRDESGTTGYESKRISADERIYLDTSRTFLFVYYQRKVENPNLFVLVNLHR